MIKKKSLIDTGKLLIFLTLALAVNVGELAPDSRLRLHFPTMTPHNKLHYRYQNRFAYLHSYLQGNNVEKEQLDLNKEYWKGFFSDIKRTLSAPFHWKGPDWIRVAVVTGITTGLYVNDGAIMSWIQDHRGKTTVRIAAIAEKFGNPGKVFPGLVLLYGYASLFKDPKAKQIALLSFKSCAATVLVVYGIKLLAHRSRPGGGNPQKWGGPGFSLKNEKLSFPSGHSALAFSLAVVISSEYKGTVIPVIAYSAAVLTALSRVHDKKHWAADIFFGSVIGYFIARQIVKRNKNYRQNLAEEALINGLPARPQLHIKSFSIKGSAGRIRVFPMIAFDRLGVSLNYEF